MQTNKQINKQTQTLTLTPTKETSYWITSSVLPVYCWQWLGLLWLFIACL